MRRLRLPKKRILIIIAIAVVLSAGATVAYAAVTSFPDVPTTYWAHDSIMKLTGQGVIQGHADGTFAPEDSITRAQAAVMLDRTEAYIASQAAAAATAPLADIARGCPACHTLVAATPNPATPYASGQPDPARGNAPRYSLKWEAMGSDATVTPTRFTVHSALADTSGVAVCLACHAAGNAAENGIAAPKSLRVIVHPAHEFSGIFTSEFRGNCFSCHEVTNTGGYDLLTQAVTVNDKGMPDTVPIPGMQPSSESPAS